MRPRGVLTLLIVLLTARSGRAEKRVLDLTWDASAECPTGADVTADVEKRLGSSVDAKPVRARATVVRRAADQWEVRLTTLQGNEKGERSLTGATCAAVASATSLILALTIDPQALSRLRPPAPPPAPARPPPPPPSEAPRPPPPPRPRGEWSPLFLRASAGVGIDAIATEVSPGVMGAFGARTGRFSIELLVSVFPSQSVDLAQTPGKGGDFWLLSLGPSGCGAFASTRSIRSGACAGLEIARMEGRGHGVALPGTGVAGWAAPTASLFFDLRLWRPLWLSARVDGVFPLSQPRFVLENVGAVFRVQPAAARMALGLEVHF